MESHIDQNFVLHGRAYIILLMILEMMWSNIFLGDAFETGVHCVALVVLEFTL